MAKNLKIIREYIDPGFSGSNLERPKIKELIKDAKLKEFDTVLVYKLDRISRSQKDTLYLIEDVFIKNDISFISINENFDTSSAFGRAMIGILSVFAQLEREQIKERTKMGLNERIKQGNHHSYAPFGYKYENKKLVIKPDEAEVIKFIYDLAYKNYTFKKINDAVLQEFPQYTHLFNNKNNKIADIIHNVTYGGYVKFAENIYKGNHEPIVEEDVFKKVQEIMKQKKEIWTAYRTKRTGTHSHYLLTGFIFCGNCGARYRASSDKTFQYKCYSRIGNPAHMVKDKNCKSPFIKQKKLDDIILNELLKIKVDENYFNSLTSKPKEKKQNTESLKKEYDKITTQINKLLDLYQQEDMDLSIITERIKKLEEQRKKINEKITKTEQPKIKTSYKEVKETLKDLELLIEKGATQEIRELLQILLEKIVISENEIKIKWKFS